MSYPYGLITELRETIDQLRAELTALKTGQGEAIGTLHISHFRQNPAMENVDFQMTADLPQGSYKLYTASPASADAVSVHKDFRSVIAMILNALDRDAAEGRAVRGEMAAELRALLAQSQEDV